MTTLPMTTTQPDRVDTTEPDQQGGARTQASGTAERTVPFYACEHGVPGGCKLDAKPTTQHTPEPWQPLPGRPNTMHHIQTAAGEHIATFSKRKDMERAVACVQACAGLSTELLEGSTIDMAAGTVTEQRDVVTDALREFAKETFGLAADMHSAGRFKDAERLSALTHTALASINDHGDAEDPGIVADESTERAKGQFRGGL